jgi:hypothetical protein
VSVLLSLICTLYPNLFLSIDRIVFYCITPIYVVSVISSERKKVNLRNHHAMQYFCLSFTKFGRNILLYRSILLHITYLFLLVLLEQIHNHIPKTSEICSKIRGFIKICNIT